VLMQQTEASYAEDTLHRERTEQELRRKLEERTLMTTDGGNTTMQSVQSAQRNQRKQSGGASSRKEAEPQADLTLDLTGAPDDEPYGDLESRVANAVAAAREKAFAEERAKRFNSTQQAQSATRAAATPAFSQRSTGDAPRASSHKRAASAPQDMDVSEAESTTRLDFSKMRPRSSNAKRASLPSPVKARPSAPKEEDNKDLTLLSYIDPQEIMNLRKKLEEERRAERASRSASAPVEKDTAAQSAAFPRKSSLKDLTAGWDEGTARFSAAGGNAAEPAKVTKSVRVQSPHTSDASVHIPQQQESNTGNLSILSNTSRRRHRAASAEGLTSAFILPDITLHGNKQSQSATDSKFCINHNPKTCTICPAGKDATTPIPVPVTEREIDPDVTNATIRPVEPPAVALRKVIKELEDEIKHYKLQLAVKQHMYHQHDPALSRRRRQQVKDDIDTLTSKIEKLSDNVYRLYDVLEGQKQTGQNGEDAGLNEEQVEETLQSIGMDPAEIAERFGRKVPAGLEDDFEDDELPGFSDGESESDIGERRVRSGIY